MIKNIIIGVATTVSLFMAITVFTFLGFEPLSWSIETRAVWSFLLIMTTILGIVLGLIIETLQK